MEKSILLLYSSCKHQTYVIMRLTLVVEMRSSVIMPVIMRVIMSMPMMMATHSKHSEQINAQAQAAD